jgi:hypothetical protein
MDFKNLIDEIKQLNRSTAGFKLFMHERKASIHTHSASADLKLNLMDLLHQEHGEDYNEDTDEDDQENPTKKKVCMLSVGGTSVATAIADVF